ncbi:MAG: hypothetical protein GF364_00250 [Candidatus Lokiarchaeota archaeon]|nr:hypothetical protein [Candidatus Lokiarchaeota archaeon]
MYPIEDEDVFKIALGSSILFFSCLSFEERCVKLPRLISENFDGDIIWSLFFLIDNLSSQKEECRNIQYKIGSNLLEELNIQLNIPEYDLHNPSVINYLVDTFSEVLKKESEIDSIIVDISTTPKKIFIPFIKWLLDEELNLLQNKNLFITYTKPEQYGRSEMESEPLIPEILINNLKNKEHILWAVFLGFKATFLQLIWEFINNMKMKMKIIPYIGFPSFRPDFLDRSLVLHAKALETNEELYQALKRNTEYCPTDDPYAVFHIIRDLVEKNEDKEIILTALGAKPITLGVTLAAIEYDLPIIHIQPKTYHKDYSKGFKKSHFYWIYKRNELTYI